MAEHLVRFTREFGKSDHAFGRIARDDVSLKLFYYYQE